MMQNVMSREWRDSAPYWEKHARTIQRMFSPVTSALIEEGKITAGRTVLDVAGGPGEPSLTIAEVLETSGSVTCTDVIAQMVEAAKNEAGRRGLTNINFSQCRADALPFVSSCFNIVVCRLGIMFFPDPAGALREMLRVAKPRGAISLAVWDKSELNPFSHVVTNAVSRYLPNSPAAPCMHDAFRFAEKGVLAGILGEAGASDIHERVLKFQIEAPISPAEFWALRSEISGTLREKLSKLSAEEREQVARDVQEAAREFFPNNQMRFPAQMIIVTGTKPTFV